jgi:hypothetical protein
MTLQKSPRMPGPEGRPPNVSSARKGWEIDTEEDPSAVGAALNRSTRAPDIPRIIRRDGRLGHRAITQRQRAPLALFNRRLELW